MVLAAVVFFASLISLALLFTLKSIESKRGTVFLPGLRGSADTAALSLKRELANLRGALSRIPPTLVLIGRYALHEIALASARLARLMESQSHKVADMVSHKRSFEKRDRRPPGPRSEFLKQVSDVKNDEREDESREI